MEFYADNAFPEAYRGDAFVAMHGSWNREPPVGYEIARIRFDDNGQPTSIEPFISGFLFQQSDGSWVQFGRPAAGGVAVTPGGALLFSDDSYGVIYRVTYAGDGGSQQASR